MPYSVEPHRLMFSNVLTTLLEEAGVVLKAALNCNHWYDYAPLELLSSWEIHPVTGPGMTALEITITTNEIALVIPISLCLSCTLPHTLW